MALKVTPQWRIQKGGEAVTLHPIPGPFQFASPIFNNFILIIWKKCEEDAELGAKGMRKKGAKKVESTFKQNIVRVRSSQPLEKKPECAPATQKSNKKKTECFEVRQF